MVAAEPLTSWVLPFTTTWYHSSLTRLVKQPPTTVGAPGVADIGSRQVVIPAESGSDSIRYACVGTEAPAAPSESDTCAVTTTGLLGSTSAKRHFWFSLLVDGDTLPYPVATPATPPVPTLVSE